MILQRYSIHTPPYARGQLVEDANGQVLKLLDVKDTLNDALHALGRAKRSPGINGYQASEIESAILAIESIVGPIKTPEVSHAA